MAPRAVYLQRESTLYVHLHREPTFTTCIHNVIPRYNVLRGGLPYQALYTRGKRTYDYHDTPPQPLQATPRGENVTKIQVFWWTPVRQNTTIPHSETELCGVKWHPGAVWRRRPAPGRPGFALGALGSSPWARP